MTCQRDRYQYEDCLLGRCVGGQRLH
ncbi:protein of unknown function [Ralstonia solanacearum PSI07]|nr:protein of unknown function [Ralstonia solanacearum PSI07]